MAGVTIKDVAKAAGVSVATVSRALNGHVNVADGVRSRVIAIATQMRYSPHAAARSLSSRRTQTIGVVLPDLYGEFFAELVRGIDRVAREHNLHLLVSSCHGEPEQQGTALRAMRGRVDGLLVMSPYTIAPPIAGEPIASLPLVTINTRDHTDTAALGVDNYGGAVAMVEHLVASGRRRIAFIAGPERNTDALERLRGYRETLARLLPGVEEWVLPGDFHEDSGHRAGLALAGATQRPDAVFAANDMMALGCLFAFAQAGVRVPDDIALAGFDDIPLARHVHPALTTMHVDIAELGARATRMLLARMADSEAAPRRDTVVPELVVRGTTANATGS